VTDDVPQTLIGFSRRLVSGGTPYGATLPLTLASANVGFPPDLALPRSRRQGLFRGRGLNRCRGNW
jgi:hypothetical protein